MRLQQGRGQHPQPHTAVCICMTCDWLICMPCNVLNGTLLHNQDPPCIFMHSSRPLAQQKHGPHVMLLQFTYRLLMRVKSSALENYRSLWHRQEQSCAAALLEVGMSQQFVLQSVAQGRKRG